MKAIAATSIAAIAFAFTLASCQGRKMNNMQPTGDTVEVSISSPEADSTPVADSATDSIPSPSLPTL